MLAWCQLRNPYYIGQIRYNGAVHEGTHEAIVDVETWQRVQRLLDSRARGEVRFRKHEHHLKGLLYCATCKSRLQLTLARNKQGNRYAYYVCSGKTSKRTSCTRKAVPVGIAEELVAACYKRIGIDEATYNTLAQQVDAAFDERLASRSQELAELMSNRKRLEAEREKLINAHFADAIDLETLKRHQDRIRAGLADIDRKLENDHEEQTGQRQHLGSALKALTYCASMYERSDDQARRLANQTFFERIYIGEDEEPYAKLAKPFASLAPASSSLVGCSSKTTTVGPAGIEPATSGLKVRCSAS